MVAGKETLWAKFLQPIIRPLIDEEKLSKFYRSIDWKAAGDRFSKPDLIYPEYYQSQNFHGIKRGYLNPEASVSYDPITQYVLAPNETWVRQGLIDAIRVKPRRIIDLGCGTGTTTIMLQQAFPQAEVIGLDLSPYMLFMADHKATQAGLNIKWQHGKAEATGLPALCCDLVTMSLLLHETPRTIAQSILQESFRILSPGGQVVILDGNQKNLQQHQWLMEIFEEPYIQAYAQGSVDNWLNAVGFEAIVTEEWWWVHQISQGVKPLPVRDIELENWETFVPA